MRPSIFLSYIQVLKEQAKNSKLKGDLMNMEAVLEWESYFGQVNFFRPGKLLEKAASEYLLMVFFGTLVNLSAKNISITSSEHLLTAVVFWHFDILKCFRQTTTRISKIMKLLTER